MGPDDYYEVYRCSNCERGFIGKTKDNTLGHKFSAEFLCKFCGVNSIKGELVDREYGTDMMPSRYAEHMTMTSSEDEFQAWSRIWWDQ